MPSRRRLWFFRLVAAVVLPLATLLGIEGLLRIAGYGDPARFTVPCEIGGRPSSCDNPRFSRLFFPAKIARTAPSFSFPATKGEQTYRIFVLGGSAAQGDPDPTFGLARILGVLLEDRYPGARFEVINTAITAINSHVVRVIAGDLADADGDLFILYLGNNEVVGPYGPGSSFASASRSLTLTRASVFLRRTRLGQLVDRSVGNLGEAGQPTEWRGMEFFLDRRIGSGDPRLPTVYAHFRSNLDSIVDAASGAPVLLSTVGTNRSHSAPFASEHREGLPDDQRQAWQEAYERGVEAEAAGRTEEALAEFLEAERIDESFADLQYRLGNIFRAKRDHEAAESRLTRARDLDVLRFRADSGINETIREVARDRAGDGVHLLDGEAILVPARHAGDAASGLFLDHVHPSFHGNYSLAEALLSELAELVPDWVRATSAERPPLEEAACAARLGYTVFDRRRTAALMLQRLGRPPFTNQSDHDLRIAAVESEISDLGVSLASGEFNHAFDVYREAIRLRDSDPWLRLNHAALLSEAGEHGQAAAELQLFVDALPHDVQGRERLAAALAEHGDFDAAVAVCRETIARDPGLSTSYYTMAYALANLDRLDESVATYRRLLDVDPGSWDRVYNEIGRIEIHRERFDAAVETFEEAIRRSEQAGEKRIPDLWFNYGFALKRVDRGDDARSAFRSAAEQYATELETDPESVALHMARAGALGAAGDFVEASFHFRQATVLEPLNVAARLGLVRALKIQGLRDEAAEALLIGERVLRDGGLVREAEQLKREASR